MSKHLALETHHYFVLLALAEEPAHAPGISDQIIGDSVGGMYLRPSTLYATLKSLERAGLIEGIEPPDTRIYRKPYRLTDEGRRRLADLAKMHERAARLAKSRLGLRY